MLRLRETTSGNWGVDVESFANGDKIFYDYQSVGTMKDGAFQSATNKYQISGGTGKMKGIKGSGNLQAHRRFRWQYGLLVQRRLYPRGGGAM